jgi:hypothetical protein
MPRSTDTDVGYLRVYNTSSLAGPVTVTVYNSDGTSLASNCTLSSSLAANTALVMTAAQIESACSFAAPSSGRYRLDLAGAFPTMRAQAMVRSNNVMTNISSDSSSGNN